LSFRFRTKQHIGCGSWSALECDPEKITKAIERINDINDGAFQPMFEQPVMRALLIILAFVGIFVSEYLKLLG
jgi:hypothetical protein